MRSTFFSTESRGWGAGWSWPVGVVVVLGLLWLQLFGSLTAAWRDGTYYEYGWFVAPLSGYFFWRRWGLVSGRVGAPSGAESLPSWVVVGVGGMGLAALLSVLRITFADSPGWRLPAWVHAGVVVALHHGLLAAVCGWRGSFFFLPVTLFALSAVPYPMRIEVPLVHELAALVTAVSREVFLFAGIPVSVVGERLSLDGQHVEVTDGCSGLRSFQSLMMAGLFFGELLWLRWPRRVLLVVAAVGCAVATNVARAFWLAWTHFHRGAEAMERWHDGAGHAAFAAGCLVLFLAALLLRPRTRRIVVRRTDGRNAGPPVGA